MARRSPARAARTPSISPRCRCKAGTHTAVLASGGQNIELTFKGLIPDPGATTLDSPARPLIAFVGDSLTANGGRIAANAQSASGPAISNYSWLAAEAVGCDHVQVAFSGVAVATGFGFFGDRTGFDAWYFRLKNCNHAADNQPWGFASTPQLVVINLGTNDREDGRRPDDAAFAIACGAFLRACRTRCWWACAPSAASSPAASPVPSPT